MVRGATNISHNDIGGNHMPPYIPQKPSCLLLWYFRRFTTEQKQHKDDAQSSFYFTCFCHDKTPYTLGM